MHIMHGQLTRLNDNRVASLIKRSHKAMTDELEE